MSARVCRSCGHPLTITFCDLGLSPPSNALTEPGAAAHGEFVHPLHAFACDACFLVQLEEFETPEAIFRDYAYFSSYSTTWLEHAERYVRTMMGERGIVAGKRVVEIASNDGYLLQYFRAAGVEVLGIDPAENVAAVARARGVPTLAEFFGVAVAERVRSETGAADLMICNNVLAHVPDINDFTGGLAALLAADGFITIEFPHLMRTIAGTQFDTIYHEHFSYLSLRALRPLFARHGLEMFDVEELPTHGGSLRVFVAHAGARDVQPAVGAVERAEHAAGLENVTTYTDFAARVVAIKHGFLRFLLAAAADGKRVAGYGAAAKATTLLNYCGVRADLLAFVADKSPHKQGRLVPGVRVPIVAPEELRAQRPDYVVIFPWNIDAEIRAELADLQAAGTSFVSAVPTLRVG